VRLPFLRLLRRLNAERGIVGLDAGVVIGGVVLASALVGGVVVTSGLGASQRLNAAVQSAIDRTGSGLMLDGPVIARTDGAHATSVLLDVSTLPGSRPVMLAGPRGLDIEYVAASEVLDGLPFTVTGTDGVTLADGQSTRIEVDLRGVAAPPGASDAFTLIVHAGNLAPLRVERTVPGGRPMDAVVVLD
jgi:archaellin